MKLFREAKREGELFDKNGNTNNNKKLGNSEPQCDGSKNTSRNCAHKHSNVLNSNKRNCHKVFIFLYIFHTSLWFGPRPPKLLSFPCLFPLSALLNQYEARKKERKKTKKEKEIILNNLKVYFTFWKLFALVWKHCYVE